MHRPTPGGKDNRNIRPHDASADHRRMSFLVEQVYPPWIQTIFKARQASGFKKIKSLFPLWKEGWHRGKKETNPQNDPGC
jgi:hypothetical protein